MVFKAWNVVVVVILSPQCSLFSKLTKSNEEITEVTEYHLPDINICMFSVLKEL